MRKRNRLILNYKTNNADTKLLEYRILYENYTFNIHDAQSACTNEYANENN